MATATSKEAVQHLIDPLTAPEPSAETGPGTHFVAPSESDLHSATPRSATSTNPYRTPGSRRSTVSSSHERRTSSGSERVKTKSGHRRETSLGQSNHPPAYQVTSGAKTSGHRRRSSSLRERFPGDETHRPLDMLRKDSKKAARSPHLSKRHIPGADSVDRLDPTISTVPYHHEGPYDAAMWSRNNDPRISPVAALSASNAQAIKATPVENVKNSLERRVPLDGTAVVPPGHEDRFGRRYDYEEGANLMLENDPEGGAYKRWPGVKYHPDDIKGKGEPGYSQDLALRAKEAGAARHEHGHDNKSIELGDTTKHAAAAHVTDEGGDATGSGRPRGNSLVGGLKKRIGSLRRKNGPE